MKGNFTLPGEAGYEDLTMALAARWGADAIRDSDGTVLSDEIVAAGYDPETVNRAIKMVDLSEYKRRQSPPGIRITPKAFGKDRRVPITNKYKG